MHPRLPDRIVSYHIFGTGHEKRTDGLHSFYCFFDDVHCGLEYCRRLVSSSFSDASPNPSQMATIVFIGLFCTAAAFLLQSVSQRYVPCNRIGIILALEPASGCIFSVLLLGDVLSIYGWIGAVLVMVSMLFLEIASNRNFVRWETT